MTSKSEGQATAVDRTGAAYAPTGATCTDCLGAGLLRDGYDDETPSHADRLRWVACEACGGSGEIIKGPPGEPYNEHAEICAACEGTGRDCEPC